MIVIDTSAVVSYLRSERDAAAVERVLASREEFSTSAVTAYEARIVLGTRYGPAMVQTFELLLSRAAIAVHPFDDAQAQAAYRAYVRFGKGCGHGANLNMGDCAAYALAQTQGAKLLFVGDDFAKTDIEPAL